MFCVNDGAVMNAWAKDQGTTDSLITMVGDPHGDLTKALGMELTHPGPTGKGIVGRCKRFAMYVVDGIIKWIQTSEKPDDPAGDDFPEATCAPALLDAIASIEKVKSEL